VLFYERGHAGQPQADQREKENLIENSRAGIAGVLKENGAEILPGKAAFVRPKTVKVTMPDGDREIEAEHIILATGARADYGAGLQVDGRSFGAPSMRWILRQFPVPWLWWAQGTAGPSLP